MTGRMHSFVHGVLAFRSVFVRPKNIRG